MAPFTPVCNSMKELAEEMQKSLTIKDRSYHFKTYKQCFLASDAVDFLIRSGSVNSEDDAVMLGNELMTCNMIYHATRDSEFKNENLFFKFVESDNRGSSAKDKKGQELSWEVARKFMPSVGAEGKNALNTSYSAKYIEGVDDQTNISSLMSEYEISPMDKHNIKLLDNVHPAAWVNPTGNHEKYTLVVIGAGGGGLVSSLGAAGVGVKVAIIEEHLFGGDCLNVGCVPSKCVIRAARAVKEVNTAARFGITFDTPPKIDFGVAMERLRKIRSDIAPHDSLNRVKNAGIDVYQGRADFVAKNQIRVKGKILEFQKCVIAAGASAAVPPIAGLNTVPFLTNANVFNLTELPPRVVVIGAGPIGLELAQSFARFGAKVTTFVRGNQLLPKEDQDAAKIIAESLVEDGIKIHYKSKYLKVVQSKIGDKYRAPWQEITVHVEVDGEKLIIPCDALLVATGRKPNVEGYGLDIAEVKYDTRNGIKIDEYLQTSNKNIFAVGDVCTKFQFTHMADFMARLVIRNALFFGNAKHTALLVPWATFTEPEVAHVGLYEADMDKQKIKYDTYTRHFKDVDRAIADGELEGFVKIHCKKGSDTIIGATIVNANAGNMISEITVAMQNKVGLGSIATCIHPYPTQSEAIRQCGDLYSKTRLTPMVKGLLTRIGNRSLT